MIMFSFSANMIFSPLLNINFILLFQFLDTLIEECSKEITIKVPDIGEHFTSEWSDELLFEEQNVSSTKGNDFKKNGFSA